MSDTNAVEVIPGGGQTTLTLTNNWLDSTTTLLNINAPLATSFGFPVSNTWYPYIQPTYSTWVYSRPEKITLKLSEIGRLRSAAKKDRALRSILEKFTGHIEIEVDFE